MDEERIKRAVLALMERTDFAGQVAGAVGASIAAGTGVAAGGAAASSGSRKLLSRIVLGDILDDGILGARPQDRSFPLRLFFSELGTLLASDADEGPALHAAELAFAAASGLNFFFRAPMDPEAKIRVGIETSRQVYTLAAEAKLDADVVARAAPLLATLMSSELERARFESVDHVKVFDSQIHERTAASDPTGSRIVRPASFLCRVSTNNAVKMKAQVVT
ncbi:MAG: hypothetical protein JWP97_6039 [Labilithrix sp.]|nr:hypothetical protein [Labilithrix sp.]